MGASRSATCLSSGTRTCRTTWDADPQMTLRAFCRMFIGVLASLGKPSPLCHQLHLSDPAFGLQAQQTSPYIYVIYDITFNNKAEPWARSMAWQFLCISELLIHHAMARWSVRHTYVSCVAIKPKRLAIAGCYRRYQSLRAVAFAPLSMCNRYSYLTLMKPVNHADLKDVDLHLMLTQIWQLLTTYPGISDRQTLMSFHFTKHWKSLT